MKRSMLFLVVIVFISSNIFYAQNAEKNKQKEQFIYVLHLEKNMQDSTAWTPDKMKIAQEHFTHLQKLLADGILILGGRTQTPLSQTFGIVIFEAGSLKEAKEIAENDPAVKGKIMNVEVFPYKIALMRNMEKN